MTEPPAWALAESVRDGLAGANGADLNGADNAANDVNLVEAAPDLELTAPVALSIVCFRYRPPGWRGSGEDLDALNRRINDAVNDGGRYYFTPTSLDGRYSLRACIIHYDTGATEVDGLVAAVREAGARLLA